VASLHAVFFSWASSLGRLRRRSMADGRCRLQHLMLLLDPYGQHQKGSNAPLVSVVGGVFRPPDAGSAR